MFSFSNDDDLARTGAIQWLEKGAEANAQKSPHLVALSGGRITKTFFAAVVELSEKKAISLENVHFFWADERCLPPTDPESNFYIADQLLFRPLKIHPSKIHRIHGEADPVVAANSAIFELSSIATKDTSGQPRFDLIFLGMGEDGHVASLFPNASAETIASPAPFLTISDSPKPPSRRISLSYSVIGAAREVWGLVAGAGKEQALKDSLAGKTPLGRVIEMRKNTKIFSTVSAS